MYNILKKIVNKTTETALFLSIGGMAVTVCVQVFARFFLPSAPDWTEELARIFFIFSVGFGAGLAIRDHGYVNLNTFLGKIACPPATPSEFDHIFDHSDSRHNHVCLFDSVYIYRKQGNITFHGHQNVLGIFQLVDHVNLNCLVYYF